MFILRLSRALAASETLDLFIATYEEECSLRSSGRAPQVVPRTLHVTKGDLVFAAEAPEACYTLPEPRLARSVASFKLFLKAQLYRGSIFTVCFYVLGFIAVLSRLSPLN